jgi:hypothetical protein
MNAEIETEAAQFLEKEYINGIFLAVRIILYCTSVLDTLWQPFTINYVSGCSCCAADMNI